MAMVAMLIPNASASFNCMSSMLSMMPCVSFSAGDALSPSSSCCSAFAKVLKDQPICLCEVLSGGASSLGINVNITKALEVPGLCKIDAPPASDCDKGKPKVKTSSETPSTPTAEELATIQSLSTVANTAAAVVAAQAGTPPTTNSSSTINKSSVILLVVTLLASFNVVLIKH
ncbi:hypothetical protein LUZ60_010238 [Juncus effusus]|nr:hypothetical protein LUZ60_010238 [Juncus effusus]